MDRKTRDLKAHARLIGMNGTPLPPPEMKVNLDVFIGSYDSGIRNAHRKIRANGNKQLALDSLPPDQHVLFEQYHTVVAGLAKTIMQFMKMMGALPQKDQIYTLDNQNYELLSVRLEYKEKENICNITIGFL